KIDLYNSVYFHRTVRAIDLAIDSIFFQTMEKFCNFNPMESLDNYPGITEYDLFYIVNKWFQSDDYNEKYLGQEWNKILSRKKEWFVAFEDEFRIGSSKKEEMIGWQFINDIEHCKILEKKIYDKLELYLGKEKTKNIVIAINTASHDPSYPAIDESMQIYDYNSCKIENRMLQDWIDDIPSKVIIFRVYTKNQEYIKKISEVSKEVLFKITPSISTNY
ncbi:MAG: hypothetical protein M1409_08515, partial [Actinobacteria bacterium]|nr:hypothetical protein [Actinomycetota bacterium]